LGNAAWETGALSDPKAVFAGINEDLSHGRKDTGSTRKLNSYDYLKFVQRSEEDERFVACCPDLIIGGVCQGTDEQRVYRELSRLVAGEIAESQRARRPLSKKSALVTVPAAV
jgi:hypothetical protein